MFAYCSNNPTNRVDHLGERSVAYEGDLAGYGGGGDISILPVYLLVKAVEYLTNVFTEKHTATKEDEKVNVYVDAKTGQQRQYQYWEAVRVGNNIVVGNGLTFVEASSRVACGLDIMCANHGAAKWLVVVNGYWNAVGPEIHGDEGYYWHYHPHRNSHTHIWYLGVG